MRFKLGLAAGVALGWWLASTPPEKRRAKVEEAVARVRDDPRVKQVVDVVARDARRVGAAVEERIGARGGGDRPEGESTSG